MVHKKQGLFLDTFLWGSASSAYQVEGALNKGGKGPSVWVNSAERPLVTEFISSAAAAGHHGSVKLAERLSKTLRFCVYQLR
ncbi:family 1 glycosylhydrolase [Bacillus velezensis]|nr:family 1 glycosylhydrolase [Bacillus velezensis]